jgi:hypothetical protein
VSGDFRNEGEALFQQEKSKAKAREPLEMWRYIYTSLKNLAVGPRFKIHRAGHYSVRPDFVQSGVSVKDFEFGGLLERCQTLSG